MTAGGRDGRRLMSEINVTPLVDVMLVLLIIFMVTAPMMTQGVEVNLPQTTTKAIKTTEDPLIMTINRKGEVFLENRLLNVDEIETKLGTIVKYRTDKDILLRADRDIPYGTVVKVIAGIKRAGVGKLGMVTEPVERIE